jgi:hypothetical protein
MADGARFTPRVASLDITTERAVPTSSAREPPLHGPWFSEFAPIANFALQAYALSEGELLLIAQNAALVSLQGTKNLQQGIGFLIKNEWYESTTLATQGER